MAENTGANVFSLEASISINTTNFEKKIAKVKEAGLILQQTMEKGIKSVKALQQFMNSFDTTKFKQGIKGIGDGLDGLSDNAKDSKEKIEDVGDATEDTAKKSKNAFGSLKDSVKATFDEMDNHFKITSDSLQSSISATATNFGKITSAVQNVINAIKKIGNVAVQSFKIAVEAGKEFSESIVKIVDKTNDIENKISLAFGGAGLAVGGASFAVGKDFEASMANVIAIMGATKDSVTEDGINIYDMLSNAAKEAGATTMFTAKDAADALGYLAQMGYKAKDAVNVLPTVLDVAKAGGMDLAYTAKQLAISMNILGKDGEISASYLGDVLTTAANNSGTSIQELMEAFVVVGGQAKAAQVPLEETVELLGVLANAGYTGSQGGTIARNILKNLYTPTAKAQKFMENEKNNLSRTYADGTIKSVRDFLSDMSKIIGNVEDDVDALDFFSEIFDVRNISGAYALLNDEQSWETLTSAIEDCEDATAQMGKTYSDTLAGDMKSASSRLESVGLAIYDYIKNPIRDAVQEATDYLTQLQQKIDEYGIASGAFYIGDIVDESLEKNTPSILDFMDKAEWIAKSFIRGFFDNIPNISENISEIIRKFGEVRDEIFNSVFEVFKKDKNSTGLINIGTTILDTMLSTAENVTDTLATNIPQFIEKIANSLTENKDKWQKSITEIIQNISTLIVSSAPALVEIGSTLLVAIVQGMATTTTEISKILPDITDTLTKLFSNKEFSENFQLAFKQIIGDLGDIIVSIIHFIGNSNNINAVIDVVKNIMNEITSVVDEILPEIMPEIKNLTEKIVAFVRTDVMPFLTTAVTIIGTSFGSAFMAGVWQGITHSKLMGIFPSFAEMFTGTGAKYVEQLGKSETAEIETPNMPIADIINQIPYGENVSQEEINKLLEQYRDANDMSTIYNMGENPASSDFQTALQSLRENGVFKQGLNTSAADLVSQMDFSWASDIGYNFVTNIVNGISTAWEELKTKVSEIFSFFDFSDKIENAKKWGSSFIINFSSKIIEKFSNWKDSIANVFNFFDLSQKAEDNKKHGGNFMINFASSIIDKWGNWSGSVLAIFDLFDLSHLAESAKTWGADMIQNFADGINASAGVLEAAAKVSANIVESIWGHSTPDEGPLKDDDVWGAHLVQNLIDGINSKANALKSAVLHTADYIANGFEDTNISREIDVNHQFAKNYSPLISRIGNETKYIPENVQKNTSQNITIQNLNINMEGMNVESDYDVDRMSDRMIEKLSERLRMLNIFDERGIGGTAW